MLKCHDIAALPPQKKVTRNCLTGGSLSPRARMDMEAMIKISASTTNQTLILCHTPHSLVTILNEERGSFIEHVLLSTFLTSQQFSWFLKDIGLIDQALLIHCSAKNFPTTQYVLSIAVFCIRIYTPG